MIRMNVIYLDPARAIRPQRRDRKLSEPDRLLDRMTGRVVLADEVSGPVIRKVDSLVGVGFLNSLPETVMLAARRQTAAGG